VVADASYALACSRIERRLLLSLNLGLSGKIKYGKRSVNKGSCSAVLKELFFFICGNFWLCANNRNFCHGGLLTDSSVVVNRENIMDTKNSNQWLDAAKTVLNVESDRALAKHFEWNRNVPTDIRQGKKSLSNNEAKDIAEALHVNPLQVIADAEAERAKDEKSRSYWATAAKKYAGIVASITLVSTCTIPFTSSDFSTNKTTTLYYVK
jgi:hypothetical protein